MKKRILAMLTAAIMVLTMVPAMAYAEGDSAASGVEINATNFPDENFREVVEIRYDEDRDGILSESEIKYAEDLQFGSENIKDLTGIEYFTNAMLLYCDSNQLTSLDLSALKKLNYLDCSDNQLTSLNISQCSKLCYLYAENNKLTSLELNPDAEYRQTIVKYNDIADKSAVTINGVEFDTENEYVFHPQNWMPTLEINATNFPDPALRAALKYESNGDDVLTPYEIAAIEDLDLNNSGVEDLTGIHYFVNLEEIDIRATYVTVLPKLPDSVEEIWASYAYLTKIEALPASLEDLYIYNNSLTELPELPSGLENLGCSGNKLTSLPALPSTLEYLDCENNKLTSLPALPASLEELYCSNNNLTSLPALPGKLENLRCEGNQLTALPQLPDSLTVLQSQNNQLRDLPVLPMKLQTLYVCENEISGILDLSQLRYLDYVDVSNNRITGIVLNPDAKYSSLWVSGNAMKSEADVTGRSDIVWGEDGRHFGYQKSVCELNGHNYKAEIAKASFDNAGSSVMKCAECGSIDFAAKTEIAKVTVPKNITKTYSGSTLAAPKFVVKDSAGKTLKAGTDYTVKKVTSAKLKNVGKYQYKITLTGAKYTGSKSVYVTVNPAKTSISKITKPAKKQIKVTWKKKTAQVTGYQIRYSTKSSMKNSTTVTIKKAKTTSTTIKKLKSKKKYWVQVRTYKTVSGKKYYSEWSGAKTVTTK